VHKYVAKLFPARATGAARDGRAVAFTTQTRCRP